MVTIRSTRYDGFPVSCFPLVFFYFVWTGNLFLFIFSPHPFYIPDTIFALFLSPSPSLDVTQIRGHSSRLFSAPPTTVRAFVYIARRLQSLLPPSTRIELRLPTTLQDALSSRFLFHFFFHFCTKTRKIKVRTTWGWNPRTNSTTTVFRGYTVIKTKHG